MRTKFFQALCVTTSLLALTSAISIAKPNTAEIKKTLEALSKRDGYRNGTVAFSLARVSKQGKVFPFFSYNGGKSLMPASTMKVITTGIGLKTLGADYQFKTDLAYRGEIVDGVLKGSVYIIGHGDPTLDKRAFAAWLESIKKAGITRIEGAVIADASEYKTEMLAEGVEWGDIGNYYGAGAGALCFTQNMMQVVFKPGKVTGKAELLRTIPNQPDIKWVNEMTTGAEGSGDNGYIFSSPFGKTIHLRGSIPAGAEEFAIYGSMPDPALCCAQQFQQFLLDKEVTVDQKATTVRHLTNSPELAKKLNWNHKLAATTLLYQTLSEELSKIATITNFRSDNLYANAILRRTCFEKTKKSSHAASAKFIKKFLTTAKIPIQDWRLHDGSGLSRRNLVTADGMAHFLAHMLADKTLKDTFRTTIPIVGREGSVTYLGLNTNVAGRARAKIGYISRVKAYSGYIRLDTGEYLAFAYILNNQTDNSLTDATFLKVLGLVK